MSHCPNLGIKQKGICEGNTKSIQMRRDIFPRVLPCVATTLGFLIHRFFYLVFSNTVCMSILGNKADYDSDTGT